MAKSYDPQAIEQKWQRYWREHATFSSTIDPNKPKFYVLDMFPYPSGAGLHVGHPKGYIATDIISRYRRMRGFNVLHPMGWDAFGLPAEQYAIETGTHPRETTKKNIQNFKRQFQALGMDYDWSREIDTTDPKYIRWTQWIFSKLYEKNLAYLAEVPVNWCPALGTVLANEEIIDGKSERGGHPVVRVPMRQWVLRITAYADRLIEDLDSVDWPESIKRMQRDWVGRSEGARINFELVGHPGQTLEVFTTRPDTLFGATYMVLAPEHVLVPTITTVEQRPTVEVYVEEVSRRSDRARMADAGEKTGVFTGAYAIHPVTGSRVPIWIADYVLATYGTGAIMAVPAHDTRDYAFAKQFNLPILEVIAGGDISTEAFTGDGKNVNSDFLNGLTTPQAKQRMNDWLVEHGKGEKTVNYKLRDWLFSRQRYWGEPFPVIHLEDGTTKLVPASDLPVLLPELDDFRPSGEFEPPLARVRDWVEVTDPETKAKALRDTNTMPQWAGSCWYYLRFCDPSNDREAWSKAAEQYWMPVDLYVGGAEHAVLHLLYSRFWHKVLFDLGLVHTKEPFQKLLNPGMILGYSYRYFDNNLSDDPRVTAKAYPAFEVRFDNETPLHKQSGEELKTRWVAAKDVRWSEEEQPLHPTIEGLQLEEVTEKMSKSRGNVVNPDDIITEYGTDALRLYEMFMGPLDKGAPWSTDSIPGVSRFLQRAYRLFMGDREDETISLVEGTGTPEQARLTAETIQGVSLDLESMGFNTAISKLMVFVRDICKDAPLPRASGETFLMLLSPFAPHIAEELWARIGHSSSIALQPWPTYDSSLIVKEEMTIPLQVNGKLRSKIVVPADSSQEDIVARAQEDDKVLEWLKGAPPRKVIYVEKKLVNFVV
ncbi:leucine--tRNA ligase [Candidatus Nitronereus thalassa]|uniref:Leucine--tRNA ligase n=1 Tax=Candidatus Nitronereus thalassa TaxID=3020898 RepID=A0ABU3KAH7_9BACT|nr:leucine--tRNA ligase [Candidatus Nitronereus thalassa]MDT7043313.1 leucine--tRNA ligase [Candidatus Nitronereus thalassa]